MRDDIDPELERLYALDREAPLPAGAATRVLAGVIATVAVPGAAAAATATAAAVTGGVARRTVLAIALASAVGGGVAGVAGYRALAPRSTTPVSVPVRADAAPVVTPDAAPMVAPDAAVPDAAVADAPAQAHAGTTTPAPAQPAADTREALLIDRGRAALRRGMLDEALATLMQHERLYPHGALAEERSVLVIEAYAAQGNATLARRRIAAYRAAYPAGFLRDRVDRAEAALPAAQGTTP